MKIHNLTFSFFDKYRYNKGSKIQSEILIARESATFWLVMAVFALMIAAILFAAYNDDKTKGL